MSEKLEEVLKELRIYDKQNLVFVEFLDVIPLENQMDISISLAKKLDNQLIFRYFLTEEESVEFLVDKNTNLDDLKEQYKSQLKIIDKIKKENNLKRFDYKIDYFVKNLNKDNLIQKFKIFKIQRQIDVMCLPQKYKSKIFDKMYKDYLEEKVK